MARGIYARGGCDNVRREIILTRGVTGEWARAQFLDIENRRVHRVIAFPLLMMTTLAQQFLALPADQKRKVQFLLCENALQRWREFVATQGGLGYRESVCGTSHAVDTRLPEEAFHSAQRGHDFADVRQRYLEPITALQGQDLEFPEPIEYAYYAIYNLFLKYGRSEETDDWLIVNQALSTEPDESKWGPLFEQALTTAIERGANGF